MSEVEHVLDIKNKLGEGPVWNPTEQALYWVDIERNRFYRMDPTTRKYEVFDVSVPVGVLALRASGGLVMATKNGFAFWDRQHGLRFISDPEAEKPHTRFNDGAVDCRGRFWAGTMCGLPEMCEAPEGSLYRLDPDSSIHRMETGLKISNGIGWSPDNKVMYLTDSPQYMIYAYDFDAASGAVENRRTFIHTSDEEGVPDGLAVDSEGCIWSCAGYLGHPCKNRRRAPGQSLVSHLVFTKRCMEQENREQVNPCLLNTDAPLLATKQREDAFSSSVESKQGREDRNT